MNRKPLKLCGTVNIVHTRSLYEGQLLVGQAASAQPIVQGTRTVPIRREITCITKTNRQNPHERIQRVGGSGFNYSESEAIIHIESGTYTFWTRGGGKETDVIVARHLGNKYLKTMADGVVPDNLLALRSC